MTGILLNFSRTKPALYYGGLFAATVGVSAALFSGVWLPAAALVAVGALIACVHFVSSTTLHTSFQTLVVLWIVVCPLGYSLLQIPRSFTVISPDRLIAAGALLVLAGTALNTRRLPIPAALSKAALAWTGFIVVMLYSLRGVHGKDLIATLRMLIEVFVLPGIIALYVIQCFDASRHLHRVHMAICVVTIYLAMIGIVEVKAGTDLLATGADRNDYFAGAGDLQLLRANGPYGTNSTYATVGLLNLIFLEFVRRNIPHQIRGWRKSLHWTAVACTSIVALLPMFRALVITATVVGSLALYQRYRKKALPRILGLASLVFLSALTLKAVSPGLFEDRVSDQSNVNARLAEYKQGLALFSDHPVVGVGLNQFYNSVADRYKYLFYFKGESSLDYPHSLSISLLAETGLVGFLLFVTAQVTMLAGFRKLLSYPRSVRTSPAWNVAILMFVTYCGMNIDLVSGYYDELNVWYLFVLALVVKCGVQQAQYIPARQIRRDESRMPVHAM